MKSRASCKGGGEGFARSVCITRKRAVSSETEPSFFIPEFLEIKPRRAFYQGDERARAAPPLFLAPIEKSREESPLLPHPKGEGKI